jgi:hypothetical protein
VRGRVGGFPHRALGNLAVAEQDVGAIRRADPPRVQRDADRRANALSKRARRHVDEGQPRRRVPFEIRFEGPQLHQLLAWEETGLGPGGVEDRGRMPFRQDEAIVVGILGVLRIESHLPEEQHGHDVGGRQARRRVAAAGAAGGSDGVDSKLGGDVLKCSD